MTTYAWDLEKNDWLIRERGISFERVIFLIEKNKLLDIICHPNQEKYPHQRMFIVEIDDYAYLVLFIESEEQLFLKTVISSRKATQKYLGGK
jgi:uncharacterized DUF497 family protein